MPVEEEGLSTVLRKTKSCSGSVVRGVQSSNPSCQPINTTGVTRAGARLERYSCPICKAVVLCGVEGHQCAFGGVISERLYRIHSLREVPAFLN